jgi:hypothetical protein
VLVVLVVVLLLLVVVALLLLRLLVLVLLVLQRFRDSLLPIDVLFGSFRCIRYPTVDATISISSLDTPTANTTPRLTDPSSVVAIDRKSCQGGVRYEVS